MGKAFNEFSLLAMHRVTTSSQLSLKFPPLVFLACKNGFMSSKIKKNSKKWSRTRGQYKRSSKRSSKRSTRTRHQYRRNSKRSSQRKGKKTRIYCERCCPESLTTMLMRTATNRQGASVRERLPRQWMTSGSFSPGKGFNFTRSPQTSTWKLEASKKWTKGKWIKGFLHYSTKRAPIKLVARESNKLLSSDRKVIIACSRGQNLIRATCEDVKMIWFH